MFLFSKKFLSLVVVMVLGFGGEHHSAQGLTRCWTCIGGTIGGTKVFPPYCDDKEDGEADGCYSSGGCACSIIFDGCKIKKSYETDSSIWSDNGHNNGTPKCEKNKACYCNDADLCNKDMSFGLDGTKCGGGTGGGGATDKNGSVGTKGMFSAISFLFWMMATVTAAFLPSICIPIK